MFNKATVEKPDVATLINQGALIVDVRTPGEFNAGNYPNSVNIPLQQLNQRIAELGDSKEKPVVLYCASGTRSGVASKMLKSAGFTTVVNAGGLADMPR